MDDSNVKIVKDSVKKSLGIVNKLTALNAKNRMLSGSPASMTDLDFETCHLNGAVSHLAAAVEGLATLLMEHVLAPKEPEKPETQLFTVVGLYSESDEIVIDHYEAKDSKGAVDQFWRDTANGGDYDAEFRRSSCLIVAVFHGRLFDLLVANTDLEGLVSYQDWVKETAKRRRQSETA